MELNKSTDAKRVKKRGLRASERDLYYTQHSMDLDDLSYDENETNVRKTASDNDNRSMSDPESDQNPAESQWSNVGDESGSDYDEREALVKKRRRKSDSEKARN